MRSLAVALILLCGCASEQLEYASLVIGDAPESDQPFWFDAAQAWNDAVGQEIIAVDGREADVKVYAASGDQLSDDIAGQHSSLTARMSVVRMRPDLHEDERSAVAAHELAHALGLRQHSGNPYSVFYYGLVRDAKGSVVQSIQPDDVARVRASVGIDNSKHTPVATLATPLVNRDLPPGFVVKPFECAER